MSHEIPALPKIELALPKIEIARQVFEIEEIPMESNIPLAQSRKKKKSKRVVFEANTHPLRKMETIKEESRGPVTKNIKRVNQLAEKMIGEI